MIYVVSIALMIAVAFLWARMGRMEKRLQAVIDQGQAKFDALAAELVRARQSDPTGAARTPAPSPPPPETIVPAQPADPVPDPLPQPRIDAEIEPQTQPAPEPEPESEPEPAAASTAYAQPAEPVRQADVSQEPQAEPEPALATRSFDFEDIFGRRLPIWAGGIALAITGIFMVQYAIEAGLVTQTVRVLMSFLFGFGLIAGAEAAYRFEHKVADPRVRQALAGAGIATLFGAFYLAGTAYGLIGPTLAFVGLAAVTAGAIALSFRFGLPCAVLGLVGGFAAPVMVDSDSANVPLLALYLALVTGGLAWTGVKQGQRWMGYVALAVGLGWGVLMQLTGLAGSSDLLAVGGYLIVLGTVLPAFLYDRKGPGAIQIIAGAAATLQMALMVSNAGFEPLTWALYLLIAAALAGLGWRFPNLRPGSAIAAFVGLWLLGLWPDASTGAVLAVTGAMAAIFVVVPLAHQFRGHATLIDVGQVAIGALGLGMALGYQFAILPAERSVGDTALALMLAGLALLPIAGFVQRWRMEDGLDLKRALMLSGSAYVLTLAALLLLTPSWMAPVMAALLAVIGCGMLWRREADALRIIVWTAIALTALSLLATPDFENEAQRLADVGNVEAPLRALMRWAALLPALLAMAMIRAKQASWLVADGLAAAAAYGALAQMVPGVLLPAMAAVGGAAVFLWREERFTAWGMAWLIALAWALAPVLGWLEEGMFALGADPFMADEAIAPLDILVRLVPAGALAALVAWKSAEMERRMRLAFASVPGIFALLATHSLFKLVFAITSLLAFERYGMGERSVWQALLVLSGIGLAQVSLPTLSNDARKIASRGLIIAGLAHFTWFTLLIHNPLITAQSVGPTPIANWLLLAYGTAIAGIVALRSDLTAVWDKARIGADVAVMALISLLCVSLLRQGFAGPILVAAEIGATESLLLSLLGIALALAFLWWGSRTQQRSWRIGSLVLMLLAVLKVFLIDAAGLEGLLRIASFMALGFSLIGIGWVYSRQLKGAPDPA